MPISSPRRVSITGVTGWFPETYCIADCRALIDEQACPALMQAVDSGVLDDAQEYSEQDVRFGLDRILDGVAAFVAERDTGG